MPVDKSIRYKSLKRSRPLILVTNDDGFYAAGLQALVKALEKVGDIMIVAPAVEQSATSHSFTLHRPLRCREVAANRFIVDGTPADCVNLALNFILKGQRPDIIFSGINRGPNMGDDVHYSGTVSAAVEGGIFGVAAVAMSVDGRLADALAGKGFKFAGAAEFAVKIARQVLKHGLPKDIILNVNVPNIPRHRIRGWRITFQGMKNYSNITTERIDPRGFKYYWISGEETGFEDIEGSDCNAVAEGYVSITPIRVDLTEHSLIKKMKAWRF